MSGNNTATSSHLTFDPSIAKAKQAKAHNDRQRYESDKAYYAAVVQEEEKMRVEAEEEASRGAHEARMSAKDMTITAALAAYDKMETRVMTQMRKELREKAMQDAGAYSIEFKKHAEEVVKVQLLDVLQPVVQSELETKLAPKVHQGLVNELRPLVVQQLRQQLEDEIRVSHWDEAHAKLASDIAAQETEKIKADLRQQLTPAVVAEIKAERDAQQTASANVDQPETTSEDPKDAATTATTAAPKDTHDKAAVAAPKIQKAPSTEDLYPDLPDYDDLMRPHEELAGQKPYTLKGDGLATSESGHFKEETTHDKAAVAAPKNQKAPTTEDLYPDLPDYDDLMREHENPPGQKPYVFKEESLATFESGPLTEKTTYAGAYILGAETSQTHHASVQPRPYSGSRKRSFSEEAEDDIQKPDAKRFKEELYPPPSPSLSRGPSFSDLESETGVNEETEEQSASVEQEQDGQQQVHAWEDGGYGEDYYDEEDYEEEYLGEEDDYQYETAPTQPATERSASTPSLIKVTNTQETAFVLSDTDDEDEHELGEDDTTLINQAGFTPMNKKHSALYSLDGAAGYEVGEIV